MTKQIKKLTKKELQAKIKKSGIIYCYYCEWEIDAETNTAYEVIDGKCKTIICSDCKIKKINQMKRAIKVYGLGKCKEWHRLGVTEGNGARTIAYDSGYTTNQVDAGIKAYDTYLSN